MNLRLIHFYIDLTLLTVLLAQCLALPSTLAPRADECTKGFKVIISNNRTGNTKSGKEDSKLHAYVSGQVDGKHGMLVWKGDETEWWPLEASSNTSPSVHEMIRPPTETSLTKPIEGESIEFCMPKGVISGRVYIVEGELEFKSFLSGGKVAVDEPSAVAYDTKAYNKRWSFVEFTYEGDHIIVNLSFVDWVSLALGFTLTTADKTHNVPGLKPGSLKNICRELEKQTAADKLPEWEKLCIYRKDSKDLLRVLSPNQYATLNPSAWEGYYDDYWEMFGNQTRDPNRGFTINTQDKNGEKDEDGKRIKCTMPGKTLLCDSSSYEPFEIGPPKSMAEIWGCDGGMFDTNKYQGADHTQYLEILPRLCAAMVRSTLLLDGGHIQPNPVIKPDQYYQPNKDGTNWPTNHYSRIVHEFLINKMGYAFAYDEVGQNGSESAGLIDAQHPKLLEITLND